MKRRAGHVDWFSAKDVLAEVEGWASGTTLLTEFPLDDGTSRVDGVLVIDGIDSAHKFGPTGAEFWAGRHGFIGVEVKVTRADFAKGLATGQFERYDSSLNGLIVATARGVCKTSEIPKGIGHIEVFRVDVGNAPRGMGHQRIGIVCRRMPTWTHRDIDSVRMWRVVVRMAQEYRRRLAQERRRTDELAGRIGRDVGAKAHSAVEKAIREAIKQQASEDAA